MIERRKKTVPSISAELKFVCDVYGSIFYDSLKLWSRTSVARSFSSLFLVVCNVCLCMCMLWSIQSTNDADICELFGWWLSHSLKLVNSWGIPRKECTWCNQR